ncbi:MAG: ATP-dependent DNA helicase RecG, partial [Paenibacillaceae bacterium]|nr:ATP-dependent DNA helicase RecG [Paenibacillaceae bacterium]
MHPLDAPLHQLPRIPKAIVHAYAARDIHTVRDVLEHVPSRYVNTSIRPLTEVDDGDTVAVEAVVLQAASSQRFGGKRSRVVCAVASGTTSFQAIWFNQPYVREKLRPGIAIHITGKWQKMRKQLIVSATLWTKQDTTSAQLLPIYPSTEGLHQGRMRHWVGVALAFVGDNWVDAIPQEIVSRRRLVDVRTAYAAVHKPATRSELEMGHARCVYDEFFWYQLRMQALRVQEKKHGDGIVHTFARERVRAFVRALPFLLTASQKRAIADILDDMERPSPMNRLLQGDVGSGKTVVAAVALYACVCGGKQGALMVPTELLAQQHARNIQQLMPQQHVTLLTSGLTERQRRDIQTGLRCGAVHIVVGTHALIQEHLEFADLGLVVIDEQHRFGVKQRSVLKQKGHNPDVLAMTATPIPRTLAITAYGDRDVSVLPELPAGRIPIETKWMHPQDIDAVYALIRTHIDAKRQVYVVCPLIEQGENDLDAAIDVYTRMQQQFGEARVGLLHGKLHAREKDDTMRHF